MSTTVAVLAIATRTTRFASSSSRKNSWNKVFPKQQHSNKLKSSSKIVCNERLIRTISHEASQWTIVHVRSWTSTSNKLNVKHAGRFNACNVTCNSTSKNARLSRSKSKMMEVSNLIQWNNYSYPYYLSYSSSSHFSLFGKETNLSISMRDTYLKYYITNLFMFMLLMLLLNNAIRYGRRLRWRREYVQPCLGQVGELGCQGFQGNQ